MFSKDYGNINEMDLKHIQDVTSIIKAWKEAGLVGIMAGTLPHAGDAYRIATDPNTASTYANN